MECKKTDGVSVRDKDKAWENITSDFNCNDTVNKRTTKQLRMFYKNMKSVAKKCKSEERVQTYKTGGGECVKYTSKIDESVLALIEDQIEPSSNPYDCDADYYGESKLIWADDAGHENSVHVEFIEEHEDCPRTPPTNMMHVDTPLPLIEIAAPHSNKESQPTPQTTNTRDLDTVQITTPQSLKQT